MSRPLLFPLLLGIGVLVAVLLRFKLAIVVQSLERVGTLGFAAIVLAGFAAEIVLAIGIYPLLLRPMPLTVIVAARQLRDSTADVLPITQLGGIAFAARALVLAGMDAPRACAAVIADVTTEAFAQGLYVLVGVMASLSLLYASAAVSPYVGAMLAGAILLSAGSIGFALLQLAGSKWAKNMADKFFPAKVSRAYAFHQAIRATYHRRGRVMLSIILQLAGWMASGLWLWVIFKIMGIQSDLRMAIAIQALVEGLRSATVFVPASVGIQEAGYAALAPVFGLTPEIGLAVSLLRRGRDFVVAVPVILLWQLMEGRTFRNHRDLC